MITHKKLSLFFAGLLISLNGLVAQTALIDSLKLRLENHPQQDTVRVNLLNDLAIEYRRFDKPKVPPVVEEALTLARKIDYAKGEGFALLNSGNILYDNVDYLGSVKYYDEAKDIFEKINDKDGLGSVLRSRGRAYMREGKYPEALDDYLTGVKLAEEVDDITLAINIKSDIGYIYNLIGDDAKAIPFYTEALSQSKKINYKPGISSAYNAMGKTFKTQGRYPEALDAYLKGLEVAKELKVPENIAIAYGNIGDVYERMNKYPEAFLNIETFLAFYRSTPKAVDRKSWGEWILGPCGTA
jgi:tetratricopeptide (TPR) repeat protein